LDHVLTTVRAQITTFTWCMQFYSLNLWFWCELIIIIYFITIYFLYFFYFKFKKFTKLPQHFSTDYYLWLLVWSVWKIKTLFGCLRIKFASCTCFSTLTHLPLLLLQIDRFIHTNHIDNFSLQIFISDQYLHTFDGVYFDNFEFFIFGLCSLIFNLIFSILKL
jgi:hypothetical protein